MAEGFRMEAELWGWFATEEEFRAFVTEKMVEAFPVPKAPGIPAAKFTIVKVTKVTRKGKDK